MEKINWQNGEVVSDAYVTIDGTDYPVTPEEYSGTTPLNAENLNRMQDNIEDAIDSLIEGYGTTGEGHARIGNIGIEWGNVSITSGTSTWGSSPTTYTGTETVSFYFTYKYQPRTIVSFSSRYANQIAVYALASASYPLTQVAICMAVTSSSSTRNVGYITVGIIDDGE